MERKPIIKTAALRVVLLFSAAAMLWPSSAGAQSPADSAASRAAWGKITGQGRSKSYTTRDGRRTFSIGGIVHTGMGSAQDKTFQYIRGHVSSNRFVKALIPNVSGLDKEYEDTDFTVTDIYEGYSKVSDALVKNAPRTVYVVFETGARSSYEAAVEKALASGEIAKAENETPGVKPSNK